MRVKVGAVIAMGLLIGCGEEVPPTDDELVDYSELEPTRPSTAALVLADEATLDRHIKNGLRLSMDSAGWSGGSSTGSSGFWSSSSSSASSSGGSSSGSSSSSGGFGGGNNSSSGMVPGPDPSVPPDENAGPDDGNPFSDTNVHVAGVDESDFAKFDGKHWYIATTEVRTDDHTITGSPGFQIVALDSASPDATILGQFQLEDPWGAIGQMYLVSDQDTTSRVVLLREQHGNVQPELPRSPMPIDMTSSGGATGYYYGPVNGKVRVQLVDVEDPMAPTQDLDFQLDGTLVDSRKIGDVLYLVTRFEPWVEGLSLDYGDATVRRENEDALAGKPITELLPHYQLDENTRQPLSTDCYVQDGLTEHAGFSSLVHITAIDVRQQAVLASRCVNAAITSISMSLESLYLTGTIVDPLSWRGDGDTVIHKFALNDDEGLAYAATGSVQGSIEGNSDPAFRLHELQDDLRIVTTQWEAGPVHQLFILRQMGGDLEEVAHLPNSDRPEPIGKPNEDIYSVRFEDERAFIVTFERTDPLYMIDLSDPLDPKVAGELEVPGFATYMHPLNDQYLFTLGRHASADGISDGIKAELIDVSGPDPVSVNNLILGNNFSSSEALYNLRALNLLKISESTWHIAFPFQQNAYQYYDDDIILQEPYLNGLKLLEINGLDGNDAMLTDAGMIVAEQLDHNDYSRFISRGLLQGNAAFYAHKNAIWAAGWDSPDAAIGPIAADPGPCTPTVYDGIEVDIRLDTAEAYDACAATVTVTDDDYHETLKPQENGDSAQSCLFTGLEERAGTYILRAELPGFEQADNYVTVLRDECHVQTQKTSLTLRDCSLLAIPSVSVTVFSQEELLCEGNVDLVQGGERYPMKWVGGASAGVTGSSSSGSMPASGSASSSSSSGGTSGAWASSSSSSSSNGSSSSSSSSTSSTGSSGSGQYINTHCFYSGGEGLTGEVSLEIELDGHAPYIEDGIVIPQGNCSEVQSAIREIQVAPLSD